MPGMRPKFGKFGRPDHPGVTLHADHPGRVVFKTLNTEHRPADRQGDHPVGRSNFERLARL
jgi:hypothetical protein